MRGCLDESVVQGASNAVYTGEGDEAAATVAGRLTLLTLVQ
jgi:hypothetical protein